MMENLIELPNKLLPFQEFMSRYCRNVASRTCQEMIHNFSFEFSIANKNFNWICEENIRLPMDLSWHGA